VSLLPKAIRVVSIHSDLPWPAATLDLMVASMRFTSLVAAQTGANPGAPRVSPFGRRLYHLPIKRLVSLPHRADPPTWKARAAGAAGNERVRDWYAASYAAWVAAVRKQKFRGLVLDYDGTCCNTNMRYDPPPGEIRGQLDRLLSAGLTVGFASGRGTSLLETLRGWLPAAHWSQVYVGLYNGAAVSRLDDANAHVHSADPILEEFADELAPLCAGMGFTLRRAPMQLSIRAGSAAHLTPSSLATIVETMSASLADQLKVVASAHSVDVVPAESAKTRVTERVETEVGGSVLAIGDQGQAGGNDYEMLARDRLSLTVDRCSSDPTRCWFLGTDGDRGPDLLARYLAAVKGDAARGFRFVWPSFRQGS
jgi:hydroxymethylpyrimidine pyrophosphatase-like HAD family hydrolase